MKKAYLTVVLMLCSAMSMANESTAANQNAQETADRSENTVRIMTRPEIVGLWGMEIPNNKKCIEYYNFKSNNDVFIKSGQEWSTGVYDYQASRDAAVQLPVLS